MRAPQKLSRLILAGYQVGLYLYPTQFRDWYAGELRRCALEMMEESASPLRTGFLLAEDLLRSLIKEYFGMTLDRVPQLVILLTLTTFIAGTAANISHQVLRMSANDPQIQMAEDAAQRLNAGENAASIVPDRKVDMASSLAPFVTVYDDVGKPVASSASLDGIMLSPPRGVLDYVRAHGEERVTWQPRPGVRIASVVTRTASGFVVAGRNMREVEIRENNVLKLAALGWLAVNLALITIWLVTPIFGGGKPPRLQATEELEAP
jgi:hypothetical protein